MAKLPRADEGEGRVPDLTPARFWAILDHVPEAMRCIYVLMVGTGVEPGVMETAALAPDRQALVVQGAKEGRKANIRTNAESAFYLREQRQQQSPRTSPEIDDAGPARFAAIAERR